jgi:hypothetical protein
MKLLSPLLFLLSVVAARAAEPDWILEGKAPWQARDSQAEWTFRDRIWIGGGWFRSDEAPPRDVWSSADGKSWTLMEKAAPWIHSDLPMNLTFAGRMWVMGGWYNGRLPGHSASREVWSSDDGATWTQVTARAPWSARCAGMVVEHRDRMWLLGGIENYYFGDERSVKNDVWSSADGREWKQETPAAPWAARGYHQAVVLNGRIYVLGGGNYVPTHFALNDVWSSADGVNWTCETTSAPWARASGSAPQSIAAGSGCSAAGPRRRITSATSGIASTAGTGSNCRRKQRGRPGTNTRSSSFRTSSGSPAATRARSPAKCGRSSCRRTGVRDPSALPRDPNWRQT